MNRVGRKNKFVGVTLTPDMYAVFEEMAQLNGWSVAAAIRYSACRFVGYIPDEMVMPRAPQLQKRGDK